jgi:hypothetical protein
MAIHHAASCTGGDCGNYKCKCDCGYAPGSFACKIRHLQINTGAAKAASPHVEITPNGRVIR